MTKKRILHPFDEQNQSPHKNEEQNENDDGDK